jgi:hypothetical protein
MAQIAQELTGDVDRLVAHLDRMISEGSVTGKLEGGADDEIGDARMVVRVYERYSAVGGNRVSLSVSILAVGDRMKVSAITSGGSTGMFFKVNTFGEEAFLAKAVEAIDSYAGG